MSEAYTLKKETTAAKALLANLRDIIGDDDGLAKDTIEGETSLNEAIDSAVKRMIDDHLMIAGLGVMMLEMEARKHRLEARVNAMKTAIAHAMEVAGEKTVHTPAVTISLRKVPPSVLVTEEVLVPSRFWKTPPPKLSKTDVGRALKDGEAVPGASLSNGGMTIALKWS